MLRKAKDRAFFFRVFTMGWAQGFRVVWNNLCTHYTDTRKGLPKQRVRRLPAGAQRALQGLCLLRQLLYSREITGRRAPWCMTSKAAFRVSRPLKV